MTYHWYARFRLSQLAHQLTVHRSLCADCQRLFPCIEIAALRQKVRHYQQKVTRAA